MQRYRYSESELLQEWWFSANQFLLEPGLFETHDPYFFSWTLAVIVLILHPLWPENGSVCYNCFWSLPPQSFSGLSPSRLMTILLSQIRDTPNLEGRVPVFISPRNRAAQLYPPALGSIFIASYDSQGYGGGIRTRLHTGLSLLDIIRWLYMKENCSLIYNMQVYK
jgi:hypothetical protein